MDSSAFNHWGDGLSGNQALWGLFGIPAILAWIGAGLAWLLAPHLAIDPEPLLWALYFAGGWFGLLIVIFGGWLGLLAVTAMM
ncbi:hypothetical protein [uncultured Roseibium sp.]|uniref:hypothetical protein n=1 Tax=uncultured Roseibium sp. TaxID=1936171 RepID=UPI00262C04EF|nr:hypothetical protein [uncultured Roseibium sp.]